MQLQFCRGRTCPVVPGSGGCRAKDEQNPYTLSDMVRPRGADARMLAHRSARGNQRTSAKILKSQWTSGLSLPTPKSEVPIVSPKVRRSLSDFCANCSAKQLETAAAFAWKYSSRDKSWAYIRQIRGRESQTDIRNVFLHQLLRADADHFATGIHQRAGRCPTALTMPLVTLKSIASPGLPMAKTLSPCCTNVASARVI